MRELLRVVVGMVMWSVFMLVLGVVFRINWEIFMFGWSSI